MENTSKIREQVAAVNQANVDAALRFASVILSSAERLIGIQVEAAKSAFAVNAQNAKALASVKDIQELDAIRAKLVKPSIEQANDYARSVYQVAASTQAELSKLVEEQVAEFNKNVATALDNAEQVAPAGSGLAVAAMKSAITAANTAYENLSKTAKQFQETAEATATNITSQAASTPKKKTA